MFSSFQVFDLHRHKIDHITIPSRRGPEYGVLRRVDDVRLLNLVFSYILFFWIRNRSIRHFFFSFSGTMEVRIIIFFLPFSASRFYFIFGLNDLLLILLFL